MRTKSSTITKLLVFILLLIVFGATKPQIAGSDSLNRFFAIQDLAGDLDDANQEYDQKYNWSLPLLAYPIYIAAKNWLIDDETFVGQSKEMLSYVARFNQIVLAIFLLGICSALRARMRGAFDFFWLSLAFLSLSMALPHVKDFYSEILWSCSLFLALVHYAKGVPRPGLFSLLVFLSVWTNPILAVVWVFVFLLDHRKQVFKLLSIKYWGPIALAAVAVMLENHFERGNIFDNGYESGFTWTPLHMLYVLVSPGKGLIWFMPGYFFSLVAIRFLSLRHDAFDKKLMQLSLIVTGILVCIYGNWWAWGGALYWGPRFFLFTSLCSAYFLYRIVDVRHELSSGARMLLGIIVLWTSIVTWTGLSVRAHFYDLCPPDCHLTWVESPFFVFAQPLQDWSPLAALRPAVVFAVAALAAYLLHRHQNRNRQQEEV